MYDIMF